MQIVVDAVVQQQMADTHLPGAAVVVVLNGETVLKRGYGLADVEAGRRVDPDKTLFRIASVSKALTCLAVTRLVQEGELSLDDDVAKFSPGTRNVSSGKLRRVTAPGLHSRYDTCGISLAGLAIEHATELSSRHATTPTSSVDSTPADMGRLLEALTGGGANSHGGLFGQATCEAVLSPQYRPHPCSGGGQRQGRDVALADYVGSYYSGIHCRSCTDDEIRQGASRRRELRVVRAIDGVLRVGLLRPPTRAELIRTNRVSSTEP